MTPPPKKPGSSRPSFPEINRQLEEHEAKRMIDQERAGMNGAFAGLARHLAQHEESDAKWKADHDVAISAIARACGVEDTIPEAIHVRAAAATPTPAPKKPPPALPAVGKDARRARTYALLTFGGGLVELALRVLDHIDHPGTRQR